MSESTDKDEKKGSVLKDAIKQIRKQDTLPKYNAREKLIKKGQLTGDPLVDMFLGEEISEAVYQVLQLRYTESRRTYVEACLLATEDTEQVAEILDVDQEVVDIYRQVYYDIEGLDRLSKLRMIEVVKDEREQQLKLWAVSQGVDFIAWRLGTVPKVNPVEGLTSIYSDCFFKAKEAFYNANTADASKEGLRWAKQATDVARLLKAWVNDADEATQDINIALKEITGEDLEFPKLEDLGDEEVDPLDMSMDIEEVDPDFDSVEDLDKES